MKKTVICMAAAALTLTACNQQKERVDESAGAQKDQIERQSDATKHQLNEEKKAVERQSEAQKDQLDRQASLTRDATKEQKKQIEHSAEVTKDQLDLAKKNVEKQSDLEKQRVEISADAQKAQINEAAGARNAELTALDQGGSDADRSISAQVRRSFMANGAAAADTLAARNVTIVSSNGEVTLRGTVGSQAEKDRMEAQAKSVTGVTKVNNQLEVKQ